MAMFPEYRTYTEEEIERLIKYISNNNDAENVTFIEQTNFHAIFKGTRDSQRILFSFDKKDGFVIEDTK